MGQEVKFFRIYWLNDYKPLNNIARNYNLKRAKKLWYRQNREIIVGWDIDIVPAI